MPTRPNTKTARLSRMAANECVNFNLRKADRAVSQVYDKAIASSGLKGTQFTLLNAVSLTDGASISSLAHAMVMDRTTLTRNLAPLERDGLIEIVAGTDRRTRSVAITSSGRTLLNETLPLWHAEHRRLKSDLGAAATSRLIEQLQIVVGIAGRR
jgi:DNA-binding MarR family transcriptional regulator